MVNLTIYFCSVLLLLVSLLINRAQATGFNFWESSTLNTSLANANGASARDASVQAMVPASITQLNQPMVNANVTHYGVSTDYDIFNQQSHYEVANPIPSGFFSMPISEHWFFGVGIASRAAADISVPSIPLVHPNETRIQPITVSIAPTVAYKFNNLSVAVTGEYIVANGHLESTKCFLGMCNEQQTDYQTSGFGSAISATWQANDWLSVAATHRFETDFGDQHLLFELPSITSGYINIKLNQQLNWDSSYSYSRWHNKGISFAEYHDILGLFQGFQNSKRFATGLEYQVERWFFRAGFSIDEAIDMQGGNDKRYRLGVGYHFSPNLQLNIAAFKEDYATKQFSAGEINLVEVQNKGNGYSLGISYQL
ncbi:OmpP1/FadL family transporter [Shewanella gaetbuli]|uniref:Outer membrane protein transport protein n=1 Tax=Shewanella gaetbuli TaxID=220752 RepID=A0A9X2CLC3_9GAMM|nr:outer membrane protein transport protein [Shewanella gaetbuli]MCL1144016.1 outer membrane protein transport protein [Shewanella gaetbuli]